MSNVVITGNGNVSIQSNTDPSKSFITITLNRDTKEGLEVLLGRQSPSIPYKVEAVELLIYCSRDNNETVIGSLVDLTNKQINIFVQSDNMMSFDQYVEFLTKAYNNETTKTKVITCLRIDNNVFLPLSQKI